MPAPTRSSASPTAPMSPAPAVRRVTRPVVVMEPAPVMLAAPAPLPSIVTAPAPALIVPVIVTAPVFWMSTKPPPVEMDPAPPMVKVEAPVAVRLPPPVVKAASTEMPPPPFSVRFPLFRVIEALMSRRPATASSAKSLPAPALSSMAAETVMPVAAWIKTLPTCSCSMTLPLLTLTLPAPSPERICWGFVAPKRASPGWLLAAPATMSMLSGSRSREPVTPRGARRSTRPSNSKLCLPDTSAKPPLPPWAPPRRLALPPK